MTVPSATRLMAGVVLLISLGLAYAVSPNFFFLTAFVGLNLAQSAFTGTCPAVFVFKKMGMKSECDGSGFSVHRFVSLGAGVVILAATGAGHLLDNAMLVYVIIGAVGLNLAQSAFSGWCPMMTIARLTGVKDAELCEPA